MLQSDLDDLRQQVRELTDRIIRLEEALAVRKAAGLLPEEGAIQEVPPREFGRGETPAQESESAPLLPILGLATLGLAGAYLLRALAESDIFPPPAVFAAATLYAVAWLLWAGWTRSGNRLATPLCSLTAALILSPLLFEATDRFRMVTAGQAGVILVAFTLIGLAVSWRKDLGIVATISILASLGTAVALLIATHDALALTLVFLAIAAAVETCACFNRWPGVRWLAAAAADLSVLLATWLVTNPQGLPEAYAPIPAGGLLAAQIILPLIYLSSVLVRTLLRGLTFTNFETGQCALAFLIGLNGAMRLSPEGWHLSSGIAGFTLLCGAACYVIAFGVLPQDSSRARNFYTYSTFGILLVFAGGRILLSEGAAALVWSLLSLICLGAAGFLAKFTLGIHGGIYLLLALLFSGAIRQSAAFLLGNDPWPGSIAPTLWMAATVAGVGYCLAVRSSRALGDGRNAYGLRIALAAALVWLTLGLAAGGLTGIYHGLAGGAAEDSYCATLRTGAVMAVTVLLAWAGSLPQFRDFGQLVYPLMFLGAYRLITADLHQDRKVALFFSLLLYGATLMALPRLRRARAVASGPTASCPTENPTPENR